MNLTALPGVILDGKYRIEQLLGQGGMGAVFVATHLGTTRTVAVKVIVPQLAAQDEFLLRFQREAEAAGRLRHPNVVNVTDFGITSLGAGQLAYLVMEFLDGETLAGFLKKNPRPPSDLILDIVDQVALGLDAAHNAGIVHRDLKPDNIWLESNRRGGYNVKVLDFGIAKLNNPAAVTAPLTPRPPAATTSAPELETQFIAPDPDATHLSDNAESLTVATAPVAVFPPPVNSSAPDKSEADTMVTFASSQAGGSSTRFNATTLQTTVGSVLGTPAFMAPEQCQGALTVDHHADIYSLTVITYQLFCGRLPFDARNLRDLLEQQINATPPAPHQLDRSIAPSVSTAILQGLAKDPAARQATAGTFAAQLRAGAEAETSILANGKIFASNYIKCFGPLFFVCLGSLIPVLALLILLVSAAARTKTVPVWLLVGGFYLAGFTVHTFIFQLYKAGSSLIFTDAATAGYFRPQLGLTLARILRGLRPLLGMFLRTATRLSWNSFLEAALWPTVWAAEGLVGSAALARARALSATQPAATLALVARQYGILVMASLASPTLIVSITGGFDDFGNILFTHRTLSWILVFYPITLSAMFLAFGTAFHFLYLSARRCLGEVPPQSLPTGNRAARPGSSPKVRWATLLWTAPATIMLMVIGYHAFPRSDADSRLIDAATDGRRAAVFKALDDGAPVDRRDPRGRTPLMLAAIGGDLNSIRQLLTRGANLNARMNTGNTPLMLALSSHRPQAAALLLEYKPDIKVVNDDGRTALIYAAMHGDATLCRLLLARGADRAPRDDSGKSARDYAVEEGHREIVAILQ